MEIDSYLRTITHYNTARQHRQIKNRHEIVMRDRAWSQAPMVSLHPTGRLEGTRFVCDLDGDIKVLHYSQTMFTVNCAKRTVTVPRATWWGPSHMSRINDALPSGLRYHHERTNKHTPFQHMLYVQGTGRVLVNENAPVVVHCPKDGPLRVLSEIERPVTLTITNESTRRMRAFMKVIRATFHDMDVMRCSGPVSADGPFGVTALHTLARYQNVAQIMEWYDVGACEYDLGVHQAIVALSGDVFNMGYYKRHPTFESALYMLTKHARKYLCDKVYDEVSTN